MSYEREGNFCHNPACGHMRYIHSPYCLRHGCTCDKFYENHPATTGRFEFEPKVPAQDSASGTLPVKPPRPREPEE